MPKRAAIFTTFVVAAALCLALLGCRPETDDPAGAARPATADIAATVQAALGSLENRQPPPAAESARPAPPTAQSAAATIAPTMALLPMPQVEPTKTLVLKPVTSTAAPDGAELRPPAPMFAGTLVDGNEYQLIDTVGTPTLLVFWAPW